MPDFISTILAKVLLVALEAMFTRLFIQLVQTARARGMLAAAQPSPA